MNDSTHEDSANEDSADEDSADEDSADEEGTDGRGTDGRAAGPRVASWRPARLWQPAAGPGWGPLPELLLVLTLVTGLVDAVSILALGRVFVANMTGNVVFSGFAIAGAPGFSLAASLLALAGFLAGAMLGGVITTRLGGDRAVHLRAATGAEVALVGAALVIAAATGGTPRGGDTAVIDVLAPLLAIAMGIQNSAALKIAVPDLTTTVLTRLLTGLAADPRAGARGHLTLGRRLLVLAVMLAGGILGATLVLHVSVTAALALAVALLLVTTIAADRAARVPAPWRQVPGGAAAAAPPGT